MEGQRVELIKNAARKLDKAKMIRFDERTNFMYPTNMGRTASNYYIDYDTIEVSFECHCFIMKLVITTYLVFCL